MSDEKRLPIALYGRMAFEDGRRPVLLFRTRNCFQSLYIDSNSVFKRIVPFNEEKYFTEYANSTDPVGLRKIKRIARFMKNKSILTGLPREISKTNRKIIREILAL